MIERWQKFNRREQAALLILGCVLVFFLVWTLLVVPMQRMVATEQKERASLQASLEQAADIAGQVVALQKNGANNRRSGGGSLSQLMNRTLRSNGMTMPSLRPSSDGNSATLRFERVPFNNFLQWLHQLEGSHQIQVEDLRVDPIQEKGMVSANLRVRR